ncbi:hypothetical protein [Paenibacillus xylaniclasticus]|uniref:hypothetical protein n=1 Tax=Paenibacillus xylaniclasticus TaxID=588083 RepID=UPI000FDA8910|nr:MULTISPECIES: hypothetical protein [Paenibacillus]GFN32586.1 hypothetical protein PCURB6_28460 [Paenibacillus curdlanolyticus]
MSKLKDINVILLNDSELKSKEEIIADYLDILITCRKADEFYQCLSMFYDDVVMKTGELIIEKQIRKNAQILDELRENQ